MEKSLFISSFDRALAGVRQWAGQQLGLGSYYVWYYLFLFFLFSLLILLMCRFSRRISSRWKNFLWAVMAIFLIRIVLFDNPLAWDRHARVVPAGSFSYFKATLRLKEMRTRSLIPYQRDYLIVGSSLAKTALSAFQERVPRNEMVCVYGMRVMELVFWEKKIQQLNPSRVLLYIANYDLGAVCWAEKYEFFYDFPDMKIRLLYGPEKIPFITQYLMKSMAGFFFPEYRYSSIFRCHFRRLLRRPSQNGDENATADKDHEFKIRKQEQAIERFSKGNLEMNLRFLEDFLRFFQKKHIRVIILEGRINPAAETPFSRELTVSAARRLAAMAASYDHVRFVPASKLMSLGPEDFDDCVHLKAESGVKYSQSVIDYLRKVPSIPR